MKYPKPTMYPKPTTTLLRSKDYIASEDEALVLQKLKEASKCPYHQYCSPELIGPKRMLLPEFSGEENWEDWHLESKLYVMFKDAMFFPRMNWTCFCRECAKKNKEYDMKFKVWEKDGEEIPEEICLTRKFYAEF